MVHFYKHDNGLWLNAAVKPQITHILCQVPKLSTSKRIVILFIKTSISLSFLFKILSMYLSQVSVM